MGQIQGNSSPKLKLMEDEDKTMMTMIADQLNVTHLPWRKNDKSVTDGLQVPPNYLINY